MAGVSRKITLALAVAFAAAGLGSCSKKKETYGSIKVVWDANHEPAMSAAGAGYRVWVSQDPGFSTGSVTPVDVGLTQSYLLSNVLSGTWYVRVQAYAATATSRISDAAPVVVP